MNQEQLAFVNQQLAGMLASGIPLEGALQQLCRDLRQGALKAELEQLQADLVRGVPLAEAAGRRQLPELYRRMLALGARGGDLPGVLTLLADYYQRGHVLWTRLKGLMTYPVLVLVTGTVITGLLAFLLHRMIHSAEMLTEWGGIGSRAAQAMLWVQVQMWAPTLSFLLLTLVALAALLFPPWRRHLRWRLPGFREGALAQLAATLHLLLARGCPLAEAVTLVRHLENASPAGTDLARWLEHLAAGRGKPADFAAGDRVFPPLFRWLIAQGGEDLAVGFKRAADLYQARALFRTDLLLNLALPVSVMLVGLLVVTQTSPVFRILILQLDMLGGVSGL